jgi:DNA-binding NarL/FixJ family response regulator
MQELPGVSLTERKPRLLIAEDNEAIIAVLRRLLTARFELIGVYRNGADAVRNAVKLRPELVLLDVLMPSLDGIQVARKLHSFDKGIKIVMLTGLEDEKFVQAALGAGAKGYVFKRRLSTDLIAAINAVLADRVFVSKSDPKSN